MKNSRHAELVSASYMEFGKIIKTFKSKKGNDVVFRYVKKEDLDAMLAYINELICEDTFIERCGEQITREEEQEVLDTLLDQMKKGEKINVVVEVGGKYVGSGEVRKGKHRHAHMAELGISLAKEFREEGIGTELLVTLIDEAKKMKLRLLTLNCFENNPRALHVYEKLGFKCAGVIPGAVSFKGEFVGEVKMYLPIK